MIEAVLVEVVLEHVPPAASAQASRSSPGKLIVTPTGNWWSGGTGSPGVRLAAAGRAQVEAAGVDRRTSRAPAPIRAPRAP